jgi:anthranilate synthase component 2
MPILLIDNYDSFTYNLYQLAKSLTTNRVEVFRNNQIAFADIVQMQPSHIILSPGPGHPGKHSDFGVCAEIVRNHGPIGCPILGVCLGHQGIVYHLGGKIVQAPKIVHGKLDRIQVIRASRLFDGFPVEFTAMRYHSLIASEKRLPNNLFITARNAAGLIMAVEDPNKKMYGVQFHPESIGTPEGERLLQNFLQLD